MKGYWQRYFEGLRAKNEARLERYRRQLEVGDAAFFWNTAGRAGRMVAVCTWCHRRRFLTRMPYLCAECGQRRGAKKRLRAYKERLRVGEFPK